MADKTAANSYYSKSLYMSGLQCRKALWLHKYRPDLKDEVSESQQAVFDAGTDVGILAQDLFPGGIIVPYDGLTHSQQLEATQKGINEGATNIYEATFSFDSIFIKVDILHNGPNGWELYEVKNSSHLKDHYLDDIALQFHVLSETGIPPTKAFLVHINNEFVRDGDIDVHQLFAIRDVTKEVREKQATVIGNILSFRLMLGSDAPNIDIGPHCSKPYACPFRGCCWKHVPEDSVFDLRDFAGAAAFNLYQQGIVKIADVPDGVLGRRQKLQQDGLMYQKDFTDADAVKAFLDSLWYPLCFLDFETTFMLPVPIFSETRPYQKVPFQYSLHIIREPGAPLQHYEFLADGKVNPQHELLERLVKDLPDGACVLAWHMNFEKQRLQELADSLPDKSQQIQTILANMRDLMAPFRSKHIYRWQFNGSYSIKSVLPAMIKDLSYDDLPISDGGMACAAWLQMIDSEDPLEKQIIRQQLLDYCRLDTYGMVKILEKMTEIVKSYGLQKNC